ncbi:mechanosensitive ion channel family protein [Winogradskyella jejuensis]|uniref:Small conductance mechanosensitive channel n=1 Tax=Winogradskyella jejuensis TaxID=1089305 RepID=A0A1M5UX13_9FLAO|nr:mechanosensitive ion channel family protein [Winogradskyella jejuensis]SHH67567.1 small conductance mechanosensitive channel [Winogradskyella jejuensis]
MNEEKTIILDKLNSWWDALVSNLPNLGIAVVVTTLSYFISKLVYNITKKLIYNRVKQTSVVRLIARISSTVVVLAGLFLALSALNLGDTLNTLLTGAGISGLVIGLALQGTLSNTFSGIVLSFRKNIRVGNWVETNGYAGEVIDINLNYFVLKEADNNMVVIPNKTIIENPFKNYSLTSKMRITIECGIGYESNLEDVEKITKDTLNSCFDQEAIDKELEFYYTEFGDSSINFITRFWIDGKSGLDRLRAKSKAMIQLKKAFDKADINIPFPIRTLQFDGNLPITQKQNHTVAEMN